MKKLLLIILCLICINASFAQVSKNTLFIGGTINSSERQSDKSRYIGLNNIAGVFLTDHFAVGSQILLYYDSYHNYGIGIIPIVRYYIAVGKVYLFPTIMYGYRKIVFDSLLKKTFSLGRAGLGVSFFVNKYICFEPFLTYDYYHDSDGTSSNINLNFAFQIYLHK